MQWVISLSILYRYMKLKSIYVEGFVKTPNIQNVYLSGFDHLHRYEVIEICIG